MLFLCTIQIYNTDNMPELHKKIWDKIRSYFVNNKVQKQTHPLKSLRPAKNIDGHSVYVDDIAEAVRNDDILNIALTGSYGSGKSSILRDFKDSTKKNKVVQISFSSLGANIQGYINKSEDDEHEKLNNLTNLIQKEIVKQILFKEKYKNIPYSKYKRVSSPRLPLVFLNTSLISFVLLAVSFANGWLAQLFKVAAISELWWQIALCVDLFIISTSLIAIFVLTLSGKIRIDKIGASSISLSLSGNTSYFDEYLDEIIYFFEAGRYNVVIFEDIDRFESLYIFETLRQLNTILNNSEQIKQPVTFIYAIKDSIFAKEVVDAKNDHKERSANRTKFFDLIIPVVPFITNVNSQDHILQVFDSEYRDIIREPASVVAKHITDMRLVVNIYNEFLIFKDKVVLPDSGLSLDKLFAVVAYKNWNLDEFEKVKDGNSSIDKVIAAHSKYVDERIRTINSEIRVKESTLKIVNTIAERSQSLGKILTSYIADVLRQVQGSAQSYSLNSNSYSLEDFTTEDFWSDIIKGGDTSTLIVTYRASTGYTQNLTLTAADIGSICSDSLDKTQWDAKVAEAIENEIGLLRAEANKLPYQSIKELIQESPEFLTKLKELDNGKVVADEVGWHLVKAGHIDTEFIHYTSLYHSTSMSLKARSFLLNNVRLNKQSLHHKFEGDDDIQALLEKMGSTYLNDKSMYNISIVDHLLGKDNTRADNIIANLAGGNADDLQFINVYVKEGSEVTKFIQRLAPKWDGIFTYIVGNNEMDDKKKGRFISLALTAGSESIKYKTSPSVKSFIESNTTNIQILTNNGQDSSVVDDACRLLMKFGIEFNTLNNLNEPAKEAVKDYGLYTVNEQNMTNILGSPRVPLDTIKRTNEYVYSHLLGHLSEYVDLFQNRAGSEYTLAGEDGFEAVIDEVSKISVDDLGLILANADLSNCIVQDINKLGSDTWPLLVENVILSNTLSNVLTYFELSHADDKTVINDLLAEYLTEAETVVLDKDYAEYTPENVKTFVLAVLDSSKINVEATVNIVHDCYKGGYIDVSEVKPQDGTLYGALLSKDCIDDTQVNFEAIRNRSWETKSAYIAHSKKFLEYIAALALNTSELNSIAEDSSIPDAINEYVVDNIVAYSAELSIMSAAHFAEFALRKSKVLSADALKVILDGADKETSIKLIGLALNNLDFSNMLALMPVVGGEYKKLSEKNKRPLFENTGYNLNLIVRLKELGLVSSYELKDDETKIKVVMKSRW
jgi:hypothetical protein